MTDNIKIKDFITEQHDYIFIYSVLIALESVLITFLKIDESKSSIQILQVSLFCGIILLLMIWFKFVWDALGKLNQDSIESLNNALIISQYAIFAFLLGYPIFALTDVIYHIDTVNFLLCIIIVVWVFLLFGLTPFVKYLDEKTSRTKIIILVVSSICLLITSVEFLLNLKTPIQVTDISQIQGALTTYLFINLLLCTIIAFFIAFILSVLPSIIKEKLKSS